MNQILLWIAVILSVVYGALTAFAGFGQTRANKIQPWAAWGLTLLGLMVITSAVLTLLRSGAALWVLAIGLVGIHAITINNGFKMYGRINPSHHLARLAVSLVLVGLTWQALK